MIIMSKFNNINISQEMNDNLLFLRLNSTRKVILNCWDEDDETFQSVQDNLIILRMFISLHNHSAHFNVNFQLISYALQKYSSPHE